MSRNFLFRSVTSTIVNQLVLDINAKQTTYLINNIQLTENLANHNKININAND